MKIRDGAKLVKRAKTHAKYDHVAQMTYGDGTVNGKPTYQGCAVACLGVPAFKGEFQKFLKGLVEEAMAYDDTEWRTEDGDIFNKVDEGWSFELHRAGHIRRMEEEFGIHPLLADVGEAIFEGQETHGGAIDSIVRFAEAVAKAEGREIAEDDVVEAWEAITGQEVTEAWDDDEECERPRIGWSALKHLEHHEKERHEADLLEWVATGRLPAHV